MSIDPHGLLSDLTDANSYDPTIEDSYSVTRTIDGTTYSLDITDTAGQEEYRSLWSSSNLHSDAFLLVYDITQPSTLQTLDYFTQMIENEREDRADQRRVGPVCIVAGNKCDLQSMRQIGAREGLEWARSRAYGFMETSARDFVNIEETLARGSSHHISSNMLIVYSHRSSSSRSTTEPRKRHQTCST